MRHLLDLIPLWTPSGPYSKGLRTFFSIPCERLRHAVFTFPTPNEGFLISKVLMITFDLLTARVHAGLSHFTPPHILSLHDPHFPVLAPT